MPQDSVFREQGLPDSIRGEDTVFHAIQSAGEPAVHKTGGAASYFLVSLLLCMAGYNVMRGYRKRARRKLVSSLMTNKKVAYDNILQHYNPYYKSLPDDLKKRFMLRTIAWMESKEFRYIDLEAEEKMPLLISAAAVQLTFGLDNYLMDYFNTIYVLRNNYRYGVYNVPFEGHVSEDGIYLSWSNFIREYNDYNDGQNVGLHEMAHALTYVNFRAESGIDKVFHDKFTDFSAVARPVFQKVQDGVISFFGTYAATNYEEFWAVCIETFFERSDAFRQQLPELYFAVVHLLNQDPLTTPKMILLPENSEDQQVI